MTKTLAVGRIPCRSGGLDAIRELNSSGINTTVTLRIASVNKIFIRSRVYAVCTDTVSRIEDFVFFKSLYVGSRYYIHTLPFGRR